MPTAFKDLTATAGVTTTMGSTLLRDQVPDVDAHVVTLVEAAGFVSLGKTNTPEFGLSSYTDNDVVGPARTPWDTTRNAGGSSGGAAAAVAARLLPLAPGSDGGGSIRIPASACGVFGFKPSRGRVSGDPTAATGPASRSAARSPGPCGTQRPCSTPWRCRCPATSGPCQRPRAVHLMGRA